MNTHPEQTPNEVYLGNTTRARGIPPHLADFTSVRLGLIAYGNAGEKLPPSDACLPMFVGRNEAERYDHVMSARLSATRTGIAPPPRPKTSPVPKNDRT